MAQVHSDAAAPGGAPLATIDLDGDVLTLPAVSTLPLGRRGQLDLLHRQLRWCEGAVRVAQRQAAAAMRDGDLEESARWDAVRRLRALAWKVCLEVLPLVGRIPAPLRAHEDYVEVERAAHALRRATEDALADNANYTVDLVTAMDDAERGHRHRR